MKLPSKIQILCFMLLGLSFNSWSYTSKDINLNKVEYSRWVKPQLRNIQNDYIQLLSLVNPDLKELKPIFSQFDNFKKNEKEFIQACSQKSNSRCIEIINIYLDSIQKSLALFEVQKLENDFFLNQPDNVLDSYNKFSKFQLDLIDIYMEFFNYHFYYLSDMAGHISPKKLINRLSHSYNFFNVYIISTLDRRYSLSFHELWNGYIKPINTLSVYNSEYPVFLRFLNQLNLRWNSFNVDLTKKNVKLPKKINKLLNTMHSRWNSVLKVTLR